MIKIDPTSLQGLEELKKRLEVATKEAAKQSAEELAGIVEFNIRKGYVDDVIGLGEKWPEISPERFEQLEKADLIPHEGLVAETRRLLESLQILETLDDGFVVTVTQWYAIWMEFGYDPFNIPARPFFNPATLHFKTEELYRPIISQVIKDAMR